MKSLLVQQHPLSSAKMQLDILNAPTSSGKVFPAFHDKLRQGGLYPLRPTGIEIFQINLGKQCNQTCKHCHVDAGPDRKERMSRETLEQCVAAIAANDIPVVDITGGAPEMHPDFRWLVAQCAALGRKVIVRCNLTIILANKKYYDLPEFYKEHNVEVVSSLPFYNADRTDRQRGDGVFGQSIKALQMLNTVGYGTDGSGYVLDLVYNPGGAFLPAAQQELERQFKRALMADHGISFNHLYAITNMPISRFLDFLLESGNYEGYMDKLVSSFNIQAAKGVMCRNTISVSWEGYLYDCDFNQMLDLGVDAAAPAHVSEFDMARLNERQIVLQQHCYGCTAGAGSSCGGTTA